MRPIITGTGPPQTPMLFCVPVNERNDSRLTQEVGGSTSSSGRWSVELSSFRLCR